MTYNICFCDVLQSFKCPPPALPSFPRSFREALDMEPDDADFAVRGPLLCLYLDRAMTEEPRRIGGCGGYTPEVVV